MVEFGAPSAFVASPPSRSSSAPRTLRLVLHCWSAVGRGTAPPAASSRVQQACTMLSSAPTARDAVRRLTFAPEVAVAMMACRTAAAAVWAAGVRFSGGEVTAAMIAAIDSTSSSVSETATGGGGSAVRLPLRMVPEGSQPASSTPVMTKLANVTRMDSLFSAISTWTAAVVLSAAGLEAEEEAAAAAMELSKETAVSTMVTTSDGGSVALPPPRRIASERASTSAMIEPADARTAAGETTAPPGEAPAATEEKAIDGALARVVREAGMPEARSAGRKAAEVGSVATVVLPAAAEALDANNTEKVTPSGGGAEPAASRAADEMMEAVTPETAEGGTLRNDATTAAKAAACGSPKEAEVTFSRAKVAVRTTCLGTGGGRSGGGKESGAVGGDGGGCGDGGDGGGLGGVGGGVGGLGGEGGGTGGDGCGGDGNGAGGRGSCGLGGWAGGAGGGEGGGGLGGFGGGGGATTDPSEIDTLVRAASPAADSAATSPCRPAGPASCAAASRVESAAPAAASAAANATPIATPVVAAAGVEKTERTEMVAASKLSRLARPLTRACC